jgi:hypothetical protein
VARNDVVEPDQSVKNRLVKNGVIDLTNHKIFFLPPFLVKGGAKKRCPTVVIPSGLEGRYEPRNPFAFLIWKV